MLIPFLNNLDLLLVKPVQQHQELLQPAAFPGVEVPLAAVDVLQHLLGVVDAKLDLGLKILVDLLLLQLDCQPLPALPVLVAHLALPLVA